VTVLIGTGGVRARTVRAAALDDVGWTAQPSGSHGGVPPLPPLTLRNRRALRAAVLAEITRTEEQIAALTRTFADIVDAVELTNNDDEHDPEGTTIAFERSQAGALLGQARADRVALQAAFTRVDDDSFGVCENCGAFIGVERLMALPSATRCITCAG
jgi:DnaK suppressor protein